MSPHVNVRLPDHLLRAARSAAKRAGIGLAPWIRALVEKETGVAAGAMKVGVRHADPERVTAIARKAGLARAAKAAANRG